MVLATGNDGLVRQGGGVIGVLDEIAISDGFLGEPGSGHPVGSPRHALWHGVRIRTDSTSSCRSGVVTVDGLPVHADAGAAWTHRVHAVVRADRDRPGEGVARLVRSVRSRGTHTDYEISPAGGQIIARVSGVAELEPGQASQWTIEKVWIP